MIPTPPTLRQGSETSNRRPSIWAPSVSCLYCLDLTWRHRHDLYAAFIALVVVLIGLGASLGLFLWSQTTLREYYLGDLNHKCHALADLLGFDFTMNYGTYVSDTTGYFYTLSDMTLDIANKYLIPASSYIPECDAVTLHAILSRHMIPAFESQFNLRVTEPNDTMTKIGIAMPITFRIDLPPLVKNHTLPLGYNVFPVPEVALGARTSLALGKPVLTLIDSKPPTPILPPRERLFLSKTVDNVSIRNFATWSIQVLIATQPALNRTMFPDLVKDVRVQVHDTVKGMDLFDRFPQPLSPNVKVDLENAKASDIVTFPVQAFDRTWSVRCTGLGSRRAPRPYIMLAILLLAFVLIAELIRRAAAQAFKQRWMSSQMSQHEAMVNSAHKYAQAIVQAFPDPLFVLDQAGYLVGSNQVALSRFGQLSERGQGSGPAHVSDVIQSGSFSTSVPAARTGTSLSLPLAVGPPIPEESIRRELLTPGVHQLGWVCGSRGLHGSAEPFMAEAVVSTPVIVSASSHAISRSPPPPQSRRRHREANWAASRNSSKYKQVFIVHDVTEYKKSLGQCEHAALAAHSQHTTEATMLKLLLAELTPQLQLLAKSHLFSALTTSRLASTRIKSSNCARAARLTIDILSNASILVHRQDSTPPKCTSHSPPIPRSFSSASSHTQSVQYPWIDPSAVIQLSIDAMQPILDSRRVHVTFVTCTPAAISGPITASASVTLALQKLVQIAVHATKFGGHVCLELAVDPRSRALRVRCRGDFRVPTAPHARLAARAFPGRFGDSDDGVVDHPSHAEILERGLVQTAGMAVEVIVEPCGDPATGPLGAKGQREGGCLMWVGGGAQDERATGKQLARLGGFDFVLLLGKCAFRSR